MAEKRRPINRPKYKGKALTWRNLFIIAVLLSALLAYLLGMALHGNFALQKEVQHAEALTATIR